MLRIIYCLLLLVISICSMATVIWLLSFIGFELLLVAGACFIAFASIVTLAEELVEWRRRREASPVQRQLLPPATANAVGGSVDEAARPWRAFPLIPDHRPPSSLVMPQFIGGIGGRGKSSSAHSD
jgi:hypothetical protein